MLKRNTSIQNVKINVETVCNVANPRIAFAISANKAHMHGNPDCQILRMNNFTHGRY